MLFVNCIINKKENIEYKKNKKACVSIFVFKSIECRFKRGMFLYFKNRIRIERAGVRESNKDGGGVF